jgi:hypothetical protein
VPSLPLFTSINPATDAGELACQRYCLVSRHAAGFHAGAANGPNETETLPKFDFKIEISLFSGDVNPHRRHRRDGFDAFFLNTNIIPRRGMTL